MNDEHTHRFKYSHDVKHGTCLNSWNERVRAVHAVEKCKCGESRMVFKGPSRGELPKKQ